MHKKESLEKLGGKYWQPDPAKNPVSHPRVYFKAFEWLDFQIKREYTPGQKPVVRVVISLLSGEVREISLTTWASMAGEKPYYDYENNSWRAVGLSRYLENEFIARVERELKFIT